MPVKETEGMLTLKSSIRSNVTKVKISTLYAHVNSMNGGKPTLFKYKTSKAKSKPP